MDTEIRMNVSTVEDAPKLDVLQTVLAFIQAYEHDYEVNLDATRDMIEKAQHRYNRFLRILTQYASEDTKPEYVWIEEKDRFFIVDLNTGELVPFPERL